MRIAGDTKEGEAMRQVLSVDAETGEVLEGAVLGMFFPKR